MPGSPHALPAWLGELTAKTFEACAAQRGLEEGKVSYTARSHPLPLTATEVGSTYPPPVLRVGELYFVGFGIFCSYANKTGKSKFCQKRCVCKTTRLEFLSALGLLNPTPSFSAPAGCFEWPFPKLDAFFKLAGTNF